MAASVSWSADHFGPMTRTAGMPPRSSARSPERIREIRPVAACRCLTTWPGSTAGSPGSASASATSTCGSTSTRRPTPGRAGYRHPRAPRGAGRGSLATAATEAVAALLAILMPEATVYAYHGCEQPENYSSAVRERLELGAITPAVSYIQGQQVRRRFIDEFLAAMEPVDMLVTPTGPTAATLLEGDLITGDEADPQVLAALIHFSGPFNLTGFPAVSVPCGFTPGGLPVGMQLIGKPWQEGPILAAAHAISKRPTGIADCRRCFNVVTAAVLDKENRCWRQQGGRSMNRPRWPRRLTWLRSRDKMPRRFGPRSGDRSFDENEPSAD